MLRFFNILSFSLFLCIVFPYYVMGQGLEGTSPKSLIIQEKTENHTWKEYGTFDEFKLKGIGSPDDNSVFVKDCGDSIFVRKSNCMDSTIVYRKNGDYWENHLFLEFERDNTDYMVKSSFDLPPRIYDRYLIGDTLVEIRTFLFPNDMTIFLCLIVKPSSYDKVFRINIDYKNSSYYPIESIMFFLNNPFSLSNIRLHDYFKKDPKRVLRILNNPRFLEADIKTEVTEYLVGEDAEYIYYSNAPDEILIAPKSPYGIFGLQPGFDCFYNRLWTPWDMEENEEDLIEHILPPPEYQDK